MQQARHLLSRQIWLGALGAAALTLPLLAGCGGGGGGGNGNGNSGGSGSGSGSGSGTAGSGSGSGTAGSGTAGTGNGGGPTPQTVTATEPDGLTATVTEDRMTVAVGGTVNYTLTVTNHTGAAVVIQTGAASAAPTQPSATLTVKNPSGQLVYQTLPGGPPLFTYSLPAGASLTLAQSVAAFPAAGVYSGVAVFDDSQTGGAVTTPTLTVTVQ